MNKVKFWLPLPPSENRRLFPRNGRLILTSEARQYLNSAPIAIKSELKKCAWRTVEKDLPVKFHFYFPDNRRRDTTNYLKILCDALELGGLVSDDKFILPRVYKTIVKDCSLTVWIEAEKTKGEVK